MWDWRKIVFPSRDGDVWQGIVLLPGILRGRERFRGVFFESLWCLNRSSEVRACLVAMQKCGIGGRRKERKYFHDTVCTRLVILFFKLEVEESERNLGTLSCALKLDGPMCTSVLAK